MTEGNFIYQFEWDVNNVIKNKIKHNVDYKEIEEIFNDRNAIFTEDIKHSVKEKRWSLLGKTKNGRLLIIFFTTRGKSIRIISARPPNRKERKRYE